MYGRSSGRDRQFASAVTLSIAAPRFTVYTPPASTPERVMNFKRVAAILTFLFSLAIGTPASFASDKTDVVDAVRRYLDNLNPDKLQTALAMCDSQVSILDEFPPHEWIGGRDC